jgi:hypothetical protein
LVIGFIDHLQIVTTSNYCTIANLNTLQFTTACTESSVCFIFTGRRSPAPGLTSSLPLAISHQPPTLLTALSSLWTLLRAGTRYIASTRLSQRTPLPTVTPLLRVTQPLPSNGCFCDSKILTLRKYATLIFMECILLCVSIIY